MVYFSAPTRERLNWEWDHMTYEKDKFRIYRCTIEGGLVIYNALVTRDADPPLDINMLKGVCTQLQLLSPIEKISHKENEVPMMTLLYRPFKFLSTYLHDRVLPDNDFDDNVFVNAVRNIVIGLNNLHTHNYAPWHLIKKVLVVQDDGQRGFLYAEPNLKNSTRSNSLCKKDFMSVAAELGKLATVLTYSERRQSDLTTLVNCMKIANSKSQRSRLLMAPFFISPHEMVFSYIGKLYSSLQSCPEFKTENVKNADIDCAKRINCSNYNEIVELWSQHKVRRLTKFQVIQFARTCVEHAQRENKPESNTFIISELMSTPQKFVDEIERWSPNIMNTVFETSYKSSVPGRIHILDD